MKKVENWMKEMKRGKDKNEEKQIGENFPGVMPGRYANHCRLSMLSFPIPGAAISNKVIW